MVKVYWLLIYPTGTKLANLDKKKEKQELSSKPVNYTLFNQKITFEFLKAHLWDAADILRGSLDPTGYRQPVMTLLFLKRLNDAFEENTEKLMQQGKSEKEAYGNKNRHYFFLLEDDMVCSLRCDRNITKDTIIKRS